MGLLDALFDQGSYGGTGGGLLDLIRQTQTNQYQPNAGFPQDAPPANFADRFNATPNAPQPFQGGGASFDQANYDPQTFAPNQAQPIAVGSNYQMPRLGAAPMFAPQMASADPAVIPPNAQPAQGQLPQQSLLMGSPQVQQPVQPASLPPALQERSILSRIGSPDGLIARLTGNDSRSIAQQNLTSQFHAIRQTLQDNGDSPQAAASKAMIAVMNPEAAKTILPELFTTKEKAQKLTDSFGNERIVFSNEREGTTHEANSAAGSPTSAAPAGDFATIIDNVSKARTAGASRAQLLQQIPAEYRGYVDSILQDKALPTNMGRGKARMAILGLAHEVDPSFNEELIPTRIQMRKDFAGEGKNGQAIGAFNTVQHHAGQVSDAIDQFEKAGGGSDYPLLNAGKLMLANNTGMNPRLRDAAQKLQDKLNATEHEVASAYNSGHVTDSDRKTWNEIKASNLPADQLKQKLADFVELLNGKRESLNHMYQQTFHEDAPTIDKAANEAVTSKILKRAPNYEGDKTAAPTIQEGATATNPQTGAKITFRGGKWQ